MSRWCYLCIRLKSVRYLGAFDLQELGRPLKSTSEALWATHNLDIMCFLFIGLGCAKRPHSQAGIPQPSEQTAGRWPPAFGADPIGYECIPLAGRASAHRSIIVGLCHDGKSLRESLFCNRTFSFPVTWLCCGRSRGFTAVPRRILLPPLASLLPVSSSTKRLRVVNPRDTFQPVIGPWQHESEHKKVKMPSNTLNLKSVLGYFHCWSGSSATI